MSMSKNRQDEIRRRLTSLEAKNDPVERSAEIKYLVLTCIPELLEEVERSSCTFHVEDVPNSNGQKKLYADTAEMADLFVSMCRTYGTVTWKLMQDTRRILNPGGGVYMLSEELPEELRPVGRMPHALPKTEPDGLEQDHVQA